MPGAPNTGDVKISDLPTLKALAEPLRLQILDLLGSETRSVRELAAELGAARNRLHYHVNVLERHGLVRVVEERPVEVGPPERRYRATARRFDFSAVPMPPSVASAIVDIVASAGAQLGDAISRRRRHMVGRGRLRLTPTAYAELVGRIEALINEYEEASEAAPDDAMPATFVAVVVEGPRAGG